MPTVRGYTTEAAQDAAFEVWCGMVDSALVSLCGMGRDDLPDYAYRDAWVEGRQPLAVAKSVIKAAGGY